jgi:hypothetical protein
VPSGALRQRLLAAVPADPWQQIDTSALPVKHPSRVRGPDQWQGPGDLHARFGWDAAHGEWFYGFRLGLRTDLGSRLIRAWELTPAAVDERAVADDLLEDAPPPTGLLLDRGFLSRAWAARQRARARRCWTRMDPPSGSGCRPPSATRSPCCATVSKPPWVS